jgi:hypothetical protein
LRNSELQPLTKANLNYYLNELGKEYRKLVGKAMSAEIILIGGASVLANYGFRDVTYDVDAIITASSAMKDAINHVGDRHNLPNGWLNTDFSKTNSYSAKLLQYSKPYRTFANILEIRTIASEYLVAMKLMSGRKYKNDLSDVIGIIAEHKQNYNPLTMAQIEFAVTNLYGSWDLISVELQEFAQNIFRFNDLDELYEQYRSEELETADALRTFESKYPGVVNDQNINEIIEKAKAMRAEQSDPNAPDMRA